MPQVPFRRKPRVNQPKSAISVHVPAVRRLFRGVYRLSSLVSRNRICSCIVCQYIHYREISVASSSIPSHSVPRIQCNPSSTLHSHSNAQAALVPSTPPASPHPPSHETRPESSPPSHHAPMLVVLFCLHPRNHAYSYICKKDARYIWQKRLLGERVHIQSLLKPRVSQWVSPSLILFLILISKHQHT